MIKIKEAIVVEGKYDKIKLSSLVDGLILQTDGFGLFNDEEKQRYFRRVAGERGMIALTDSDGAGFLIRGKLSSIIPPENLKHAYIPDIPGKERRKAAPSREGKLGVEGMDAATLRECLARAGATFCDEDNSGGKPPLTKADLYELGLSGRPDSSAARKKLQKALDLPERMTPNLLLKALSGLYTPEELRRILDEI